MNTIWHQRAPFADLPAHDLRMAAVGMLEARLAMRGTLPMTLIDDTALEMLLALFIAQGIPIAADALVAEAGLPAASARRWLAALVGEQLVALDGGQARLSDAGLGRMTDMLTRVVRSQQLLHGWANH